MSLDLFLDRLATVHRRVPGATRDRYNNPVLEETVTQEYPANLQLTEGVELTVGRQTVVSNLLLVLGPADGEDAEAIQLEALDRVEIEGAFYDVLGAPDRVRRPRFGVHHVEARLRLVEG